MQRFKGRVVSVKMQGSAVVIVEWQKKHKLYGKSFKQSKKYLVDDQLGVKLGDIVEFIKVAPISKRKHWRISKVVGRDMIAIETEVMKEVATEAIEQVMPEKEEVATEVEAIDEEKVEEVKVKAKAKPKAKVAKPKVVKESK